MSFVTQIMTNKMFETGITQKIIQIPVSHNILSLIVTYP